MRSPLAFDRDPLFSRLENPLIKIETRLKEKRQRFWVWKEPDFFWFWNEDEPDFYGVFLGDRWNYIRSRQWFERAVTTTNIKSLWSLFHHQLHHGEWARAISLNDPRPGQNGVWRILWKRRDFLLQNASSGRAVRFFPESNWPKKASQWWALNSMAHDATFFAELFWPFFAERRVRLETAFEFLELPVEDQKHPVRFGSGTQRDFETILRAALIAKSDWQKAKWYIFQLRFHHSTLAPFFDFMGIGGQGYYFKPQHFDQLRRLGETFQPYLIPEFTRQSISPSPIILAPSVYEPSLRVNVETPLTAHEQLEAPLTVRDWLTEHAPELLHEWE